MLYFFAFHLTTIFYPQNWSHCPRLRYLLLIYSHIVRQFPIWAHDFRVSPLDVQACSSSGADRRVQRDLL